MSSDSTRMGPATQGRDGRGRGTVDTVGTRDRRTVDFSDAVLQALPAAAFVIDEVGTILYATEHTAETVGRSVADLVGSSVLAWVSEETAWMYAAAVAMATDYPDVTMGPLRIDLVRPDGRTRSADLWATNHLDDPVIGGIVCLLSAETAAVALGEAVTALAEETSVEDVAGRVVKAMRGAPVVADAAFVVPAVDDREPFTVVGPDDLPEAVLDAAAPAVRTAMESGIRQLHGDLQTLGEVAADVANKAGYGALWVEPVPAGTVPADGALVVWRNRPGNPSPNQLSSVYQGASILALALAQARQGAVRR